VAVGGTTGQVLQKLSATNYDTGWLTLPADYITSVTSPLAVTSGVLSVDLSAYLTSATAASTYQTLAGMSSYLTTATAASTYYLQTNPSGFQTAGDVTTALSPYLTSATAASTYAVIAAGQPVAGSSGQVLTKNSGTNYDSSWATLIPGDRYLTSSTTSNTLSNTNKTFTIGTGLSYTPTQNITISYDAANHMHGEVLTYNSGTGVLTVDINHHTGSGTYAAWVVNVGGVTPATSVAFADITGAVSGNANLQAALDLKANLASPSFTGNVSISSSTGAALFIEQTGTGNILTLHDQASDTTFVAIDQNGKVNTIPAEATNGAGFNVPHATAAPTTPVNGDIWTTTTGLFMRQNGGTKQYVDFDGTQTINGNKTFSNATQTIGNSTAASTINIGTGATLTATTKTVNVGTGGVVGSTTNTTIGPVLGASTTSIGNTTAASTLNLATGATLTATTKAVNIGTAGVAGSTTNIAIGSTTGTSTTTLQGITNGITQTAGDSSLKLATTAFVTTAGNLKANLASPTFTGTPTLPTGTIATTQSPGNNTTAVATTAFVTAAVPAAATHLQAVQFASTTAVAKVIDNASQVIAPSVLRVWPSPSSYNGTATSGAGATAALYLTGYILTSPSAGVAGNAQAFHGNVSADLAGMMWGGTGNTSINFGRRVSMAFRFSQYPSSTASVTRVVLGKIHGAAVGDLATAGIGVKYVPNGANLDFQLQVHNGTTLTTVTSSTQYAGGVVDLEVVSDGAGNATLYLNGVSVATTTGAPTGVTGANATVFAEVESTASTANQPVGTVGRLTVNSLNF
jgi:hypothetical protein